MRVCVPVHACACVCVRVRVRLHEVAPLQVVMEVSHFIIMVTNTTLKMMELHSHFTVAEAACMLVQTVTAPNV